MTSTTRLQCWAKAAASAVLLRWNTDLSAATARPKCWIGVDVVAVRLDCCGNRDVTGVEECWIKVDVAVS